MVDYVKFEKGEKEPREERQNKRSWFSFKTFFWVFIAFFFLSSLFSSLSMSLSPKIAVLPIEGTLLTESTNSLIYGKSSSSRDIANQLYDFKDDDSVKAVILDINSPGGSPVATEEISNAITELKKEKPVYVLINDMGLSGAFWIAVSADKTYASRMSAVGSIGVTSAGLGFEDFIREYNISYRRQTAGEFKDLNSPFREPTEEEERIIQNILDEIHRNFIHHIAMNRNMTYGEVEKYATGEIFLGSKALEIGFIDEIGYYPDVTEELEEKFKNTIIVNYASEPSFFERLGLGAQNGIITDSAPTTLLK